MKTTVEISDSLFARARRYASRRGLTLRAVIELGLRRVVAEPEEAQSFRLRRASFRGEGLTPEMQAQGWEGIRATIYEGRGA